MCHSDVSRHSEISIQCYMRTEEPKRGGDGIADDMGNDVFMGGVRFTPDFEDGATQDQWYDLAGGSGRIQIGVAFQPSSVSCGPASSVQIGILHRCSRANHSPSMISNSPPLLEKAASGRSGRGSSSAFSPRAHFLFRRSCKFVSAIHRVSML